MTDKPFTLEYVTGFGDGTSAYAARDIRPGFTTGDLLDYVLTRKGEHGRIAPIVLRHGIRYPAPRDQVAEYAAGTFTNTFVIPERHILKMDVFKSYGGRVDYDFFTD